MEKYYVECGDMRSILMGYFRTNKSISRTQIYFTCQASSCSSLFSQKQNWHWCCHPIYVYHKFEHVHRTQKMWISERTTDSKLNYILDNQSKIQILKKRGNKNLEFKVKNLYSLDLPHPHQTEVMSLERNLSLRLWHRIQSSPESFLGLVG